MFLVSSADIAQWEINEAFASVVLVVENAFNVDRSIMNPYGGAISIGHPFGASGARITSRLAHTLKDSFLLYYNNAVYNNLFETKI